MKDSPTGQPVTVATGMLTCGSPHSRNMSLGHALGQGQALADVLGSRRSVAEGVFTAAAVARVAALKGIEMPICAAVDAIVQGTTTVDEAIEAREAGQARTILFNLCGHGHFDLSAYERYLAGKLEDYEYPSEKVQEALRELEALPA